MDADLARFLERPRLTAVETDQWGELAFEVAGYLVESAPPLKYVTSVRAIVTHQILRWIPLRRPIASISYPAAGASQVSR